MNIQTFPEAHVWGEHDIEQDYIYMWQLGDLFLWGKKIEKELWMTYKHVSDAEAKQDLKNLQQPPEDSSWLRWAIKKESTRIKISPLLPDRPVIVKPESTFKLVKNESIKIYVRVPLWCTIQITEIKQNNLLDIPTVVLSNTWFGNFTQGEKCYWISSGARRSIDPDPERPFLAIAPIEITDRAEEDLLIEKICFRVPHLSLFMDKNQQLWTDKMSIQFRGSANISQLEVSARSPSQATSAKLISSPRTLLKKGLAAKTFSTLRELPGMGIFTS